METVRLLAALIHRAESDPARFEPTRQALVTGTAQACWQGVKRLTSLKVGEPVGTFSLVSRMSSVARGIAPIIIGLGGLRSGTSGPVGITDIGCGVGVLIGYLMTAEVCGWLRSAGVGQVSYLGLECNQDAVAVAKEVAAACPKALKRVLDSQEACDAFQRVGGSVDLGRSMAVTISQGDLSKDR